MLGTGTTPYNDEIRDKIVCMATQKRALRGKNTRAARTHLYVSGGTNSDRSVGRHVQLARSSQTHDAPFVGRKNGKKKRATQHVLSKGANT